MRGACVALFSVVAIAACTEPAPTLDKATTQVTASTYESCGGELRSGATQDYRLRLARFIASGVREPPADLYNQHFNSPDELPTRDEWRQISERLEKGLKGAGWRGCFLGDGKAWFESDKAYGGELRLSGFDRPRPWRD